MGAVVSAIEDVKFVQDFVVLLDQLTIICICGVTVQRILNVELKGNDFVLIESVDLSHTVFPETSLHRGF